MSHRQQSCAYHLQGNGHHVAAVLPPRCVLRGALVCPRQHLSGVLVDRPGGLRCHRCLAEDLMEIAHLGWFNANLCWRMSVSRKQLPPVMKSATVVGEVTSRAARAAGLPPGVPLVIGGGDPAAAVLGAGLRQRGEILYVAGSTNCIIMALNRQFLRDARFANCAWCRPDAWFSIGAMGSSRAVAEWFVQAFCSRRADIAWGRQWHAANSQRQASEAWCSYPTCRVSAPPSGMRRSAGYSLGCTVSAVYSVGPVSPWRASPAVAPSG